MDISNPKAEPYDVLLPLHSPVTTALTDKQFDTETEGKVQPQPEGSPPTRRDSPLSGGLNVSTPKMRETMRSPDSKLVRHDSSSRAVVTTRSADEQSSNSTVSIVTEADRIEESAVNTPAQAKTTRLTNTNTGTPIPTLPSSAAAARAAYANRGTSPSFSSNSPQTKRARARQQREKREMLATMRRTKSPLETREGELITEGEAVVLLWKEVVRWRTARQERKREIAAFEQATGQKVESFDGTEAEAVAALAKALKKKYKDRKERKALQMQSGDKGQEQDAEGDMLLNAYHTILGKVKQKREKKAEEERRLKLERERFRTQKEREREGEEVEAGPKIWQEEMRSRKLHEKTESESKASKHKGPAEAKSTAKTAVKAKPESEEREGDPAVQGKIAEENEHTQARSFVVQEHDTVMDSDQSIYSRNQSEPGTPTLTKDFGTHRLHGDTLARKLGALPALNITIPKRPDRPAARPESPTDPWLESAKREVSFEIPPLNVPTTHRTSDHTITTRTSVVNSFQSSVADRHISVGSQSSFEQRPSTANSRKSFFGRIRGPSVDRNKRPGLERSRSSSKTATLTDHMGGLTQRLTARFGQFGSRSSAAKQDNIAERLSGRKISSPLPMGVMDPEVGKVRAQRSKSLRAPSSLPIGPLYEQESPERCVHTSAGIPYEDYLSNSAVTDDSHRRRRDTTSTHFSDFVNASSRSPSPELTRHRVPPIPTRFLSAEGDDVRISALPAVQNKPAAIGRQPKDTKSKSNKAQQEKSLQSGSYKSSISTFGGQLSSATQRLAERTGGGLQSFRTQTSHNLQQVHKKLRHKPSKESEASSVSWQCVGLENKSRDRLEHDIIDSYEHRTPPVPSPALTHMSEEVRTPLSLFPPASSRYSKVIIKGEVDSYFPVQSRSKSEENSKTSGNGRQNVDFARSPVIAEATPAEEANDEPEELEKVGLGLKNTTKATVTDLRPSPSVKSQRREQSVYMAPRAGWDVKDVSTNVERRRRMKKYQFESDTEDENDTMNYF